MRLAFYGDDFTGSTDALEVLAFAGLRCALFLAPPTPQALAALGPLDAFGVAGDSRAMTPAEMDAALPAVFSALAASGAPIVHYKVCSTFDSAPGVGSIGRAMTLARSAFRRRWMPVVGATPALRRYCAFGHLFARSATDDEVHRIDRHPIMSVHPVTPMSESDLLRHLAAQGAPRMAGLSFTALEAGRAALVAQLDARLAGGAEAVVLDGLNAAHMTRIGEVLAGEGSAAAPLFVVGPSGVEYALTQWWRECGQLAAEPPRVPPPARARRVLAISASASALSAQQVDAALAAGFEDVSVDAAALLDEHRRASTADALFTRALAALRAGRSVMLHTARGPGDERIAAAAAAMRALGMTDEEARREAGRRLGRHLGDLTRALLQAERVERLLVSGGDTSSALVQALGPHALVLAARLAPGAPLCRALASQPWLDGIEIALKGGQMGGPQFFDEARRGRE